MLLQQFNGGMTGSVKDNTHSMVLDNPDNINVWVCRPPCSRCHSTLVPSLQVLDEVLRQVAEFSPRLTSDVLHLVEILASLQVHPSPCHDCISSYARQGGPQQSERSLNERTSWT